ncbi:Aldo/keto reductase [Trametes punicea]|nr:Aldo/keto reductase [Trametes punicea]
MSYGSPDWQGWVLGEEEAFKHIKFAYDHGIQTFDTANAYSNGLSESILGKAIVELKLPREELVIMTKVCLPVREEPGTNLLVSGKAPADLGIINQKGLSRKHIFDSVQASLRRLQLDYIDVLQCHRFDYDTPVEETMQALHDVVRAGYVRYIGMSSCYAYQFQQMQNYAITHDLTPFISMQNHYSLVYRDEEREMAYAHMIVQHFGVGCIPWSPLARGLLTRPLNSETQRSRTDKNLQNYKLPCIPTVVGRVEELAKEKGVSMAQIATAWILAKPGVTAPIIGTTSLQNLEDIIGALDVKLTEDEMKYLEEA